MDFRKRHVGRVPAAPHPTAASRGSGAWRARSLRIVNHIPVVFSHAGACRVCILRTAREDWSGEMVRRMRTLRSPHPQRRGLPRPCRLLLVQPGQARIGRKGERLAVFFAPPGYPERSCRSRVGVGCVLATHRFVSRPRDGACRARNRFSYPLRGVDNHSFDSLVTVVPLRYRLAKRDQQLSELA
jgi:hypothetical protein